MLCSFVSGCSADSDFALIREVAAPDGDILVQIESSPPSPMWFSPHSVRIYRKSAGSTDLIVEDRLANDGARIRPENIEVTFSAESISVCFRGQEQKSVLHTVRLDGSRKERKEAGC